MPDDPFSSGDRDPEEFYRGLNFLGRPSSVTLPGQEPSPGGALSAGAASPAMGSVTGGPGGQSSAGVGLPGSGISPGLQALMTGLSFAERGSNLAGLFAGAPSAGASTTPSGQLSFGSPESLRDIQYGADMSPGVQALSTQGIDSNLFGDLGGYISQAAPWLSGAGSVLDIIQALRSGDPAGIVGPIGSLGTLAASQLGLIPGAAAGAVGAIPTAAATASGEVIGAGAGAGVGGAVAGGLAGIPIGMAVSLLTNILMDEIRDPGGRRSMAENVNFQESQQVPGDVGALGAGSGVLPFVSNPANLAGLSTEQLMQLYATAAGGIRGADYLADPLAQSGRTEAGVTHPSFPGLSEMISQARPESIQATLLLDQEIARRGLDPSSFTIGASGDPTGAYRLAAENLWWGTAGIGERPMEVAGDPLQQHALASQQYQDFLNQSIYMDPATLQGMLGPDAGMFSAPPMQPAAPPMGGDVGAAPFGAGTIFPWENA